MGYRRSWRALAILVALALVLAGCTSSDGDDDASAEGDEGVLRMGMVGPLELDPAAIVVSESEMIVLDLLFDSLPDVAEVEADDDLQEFTFELPDDLTFADGTAVTAADAKYSLQRVAEGGEDSLRGVRLDVIEGYGRFVRGDNPGISGIKIVDEHTVRITTKEPNAELPRLLSDPVFGIVPAAVMEADPESFSARPYGSGPFVITEMGEEGITFEPSDGSDASLDGIEIVFFDKVSDSYDAFRADELDWSQVPTGKLDQAAEEFGDDHFVPFHAELWFGMNLGDPMFEDVRFRQAIVKAIDRRAIVDEYFPGDLLLKGIVPQGVPGAMKNSCDDRCAHDLNDAKRLVDEAFPDGDVPTVQIDYSEEDFERGAAEAIAADLNAAGIPTGLRPHPLAQYREFVVSSDQQLFLFGWLGTGASPDSYLAPLFGSESNDNVTGFGASLVDGGIAAARTTPDEDERLAAYQAVETQIMAQLPIVPLVQFETHVVVSDRVENLVTEVDGTFDAEAVAVD